MSVNTSIRSVTYAGDGATTLFPIPFPFPDPSVIFATRIDPGAAPVAVPSASLAVVGGNPTGTAQYGAPGTQLPVGSSIIIYRLVPLVQPVAFTNQDGFYPDVLEGALDNLTFQVQQTRDDGGVLAARVTVLEGQTATESANLNSLNAAQALLTASVASAGAQLQSLQSQVATLLAAVNAHTATLARVLTMPEAVNGILPASATRANHVLGFDANGVPALYRSGP